MYTTRNPSARSLVCALLATTALVCADPPSWWGTGSPPVQSAEPVNDYGPANVGQAKWMVSEALRALDAVDPALATAVRNKLTTPQPDPANPGFDLPAIVDLSIPDPKPGGWIEKQKSALRIGQLKALAAPFYEVLHDAEEGWLEGQLLANGTKDPVDGNNPYPWTSATGDDGNHGMATLGQLKAVFSLDFATLSAADGLLLLPTNEQEFLLSDGVCFSFNLDVLPDLPAKIRIYQRSHGTSDPWENIGTLSEFDEIDGVPFVRGSAIWLPATTGEYDVRVEALDATGTPLASAVRQIDVGSNIVPTITVDSYSTVTEIISTTVDAGESGDSIVRVEYFDGGVPIGSDTIAPFGDEILDRGGERVILMGGSHSITAKAYDTRYGVGESTAPLSVSISGLNVRPTLSLTAVKVEGSAVPSGLVAMTEGEELTLEFTVADSDGFVDSVTVKDIAQDMDIATDSVAPFGPLTLDTTGWSIGRHLLELKATDDQSGFSYGVYVDVYVSASSGNLADTLLAEIVDATSATATSANFIGIEASSGLFTDGINRGLQLDAGALLTTGSLAVWDDGDQENVNTDLDNNTPGRDEKDDPNFPPNFEEPGDPELEDRVAGDETHDAAVLEFDVQCVNGQLEFDYQFGSEEYLDFVGQFNDGFLISLAPVGAEESTIISLVPDGSDIVAVNSIFDDPANMTSARPYLYLDNAGDIVPTIPEPYKTNRNYLEYDGITVRLKVHAFVTEGATYRVRIAIADVRDDQLDAGVFIGRDSVRTIDPTD